MPFGLSQQARDITRVEFFGKDFETYIQEILQNLEAVFGAEVAANFVASELGVVLHDGTSFALSTLDWYGDRQAAEMFLDPIQGAILRANAVMIARQLGYSPTEAVPALVDITIEVSPAPTARLTIEKGRKLAGPNGLVFETIAETIIEAGNTTPAIDPLTGLPQTIMAREGQTIEEIFTSDGTPNQRFLLGGIPSDKSIAEGSVEVTVGGALWTTVKFLTYDATEQVEVAPGRDLPFIRFGDGIAGVVPPVDSEIRVKYFITSGANGSVAANTVTSFIDPLVVAGVTIGATLTHNEPSTPGNFRESIDSIKINAPRVFAAAQRAVTQLDLDGYINNFVDATYGAVSKGHATVPRSLDAIASLKSHIAQLEASGCITQDVIDNVNAAWDKIISSRCRVNVVEAQILAEDSVGRYVSASVELARALETFLDTVTESTVQVIATDGFVNVLSIDLAINLKVNPAITNQVDREAIRDEVLQTAQDHLLGRDYGDSFRIGDLYSELEAISGVSFTEIAVTNLPTRADQFGVEVEEYEIITLGAFPVVTLI